jgi:peptidyl-prolyl cis-trans isomerase C
MLNTRQILTISALSAALLSSSVYAQNAAIVNGKAIPKAQLDKLVQINQTIPKYVTRREKC